MPEEDSNGQKDQVARNFKPSTDHASPATAVLDRREIGVAKMPAFMIGHSIEVAVTGTANHTAT